MITRIEALNYRCLRYIRQDLGPFHVLVGPNASGKSTFLDVVAFLGNVVTEGPVEAVLQRTRNFQDLVWGRTGDRFELAVEAAIPGDLRPAMEDDRYDAIRYELAVGSEQGRQGISLLEERLLLKVASRPTTPTRGSGLRSGNLPDTILTDAFNRRSARSIIKKHRDGNDLFTREGKKGWFPALRLGPGEAALGNLPADETLFPVAIWFRRLLASGVAGIALNSPVLRMASPPTRSRGVTLDGSNLPWLIEALRRRSRTRFHGWISHLQTALPDLKDIRTVERPDDRHRYIMILYHGGLEVPSWMASDGTLRLIALTLPAYLSDLRSVYLIEEPENGLHPRAVETMFQSLSSVYAAQVLMATHSPVILSLADPATVLCFAKNEDEATDIVLGSEHPALRDWHGESNLGTLFAAGVLG